MMIEPVNENDADTSYLDLNVIASVIEENVYQRDITYMEAALEYMDENSMDVEQINKLMPKAIVEKIKFEAIQNNMLRPSMTKQQFTQALDDI